MRRTNFNRGATPQAWHFAAMIALPSTGPLAHTTARRGPPKLSLFGAYALRVPLLGRKVTNHVPPWESLGPGRLHAQVKSANNAELPRPLPCSPSHREPSSNAGIIPRRSLPYSESQSSVSPSSSDDLFDGLAVVLCSRSWSLRRRHRLDPPYLSLARGGLTSSELCVPRSRIRIKMQNNKGEVVDLYIPRKWYVYMVDLRLA